MPLTLLVKFFKKNTIRIYFCVFKFNDDMRKRKYRIFLNSRFSEKSTPSKLKYLKQTIFH